MRDWLLLLIFAPMVVDTFGTVVRRTWAGHAPFRPHCDFYYQRMLLAGMPQKRVVGLHLLGTGLYGVLALLIEWPVVW